MIGQVLLFAAALSTGNVEFDRTAAEGAAQIAARRYAAELAEKGPGEGVLSETMLAEPGAYAKRETASEKSLTVFVEKSAAAFEEECREIRHRLELPEDFELSLTGSDYTKLTNTFPRVFDSERQAAVKKQAAGIVSNICPSEDEFETYSENDIRTIVTSLIMTGQSTPVFEENRIYITEKIVDPMIAGAYAERRRQKEYLMRARCEAVSPSRLSDELRTKLTENVKEHIANEKEAYRAWGIFPSVTNEALAPAVERRTLDRIVSKIDVLPFAVDDASVEKIIAADPASHIKVRESEKKFSEFYAKEITEQSLAATLNEVPDAEKEELSGYLKERLDSEAVTKAVDRLIRREVMPKWKSAREAVAARQAETLWPTLANGTWFPPPALADETAARSDYTEALREWRKVSGLKDLAEADGGKPILEETSGRVDKQIAQAFDRARSAIAAQNAIVDKEHQAVIAALRSDGTRPTLSAIIENLTKVTEEKWNESRLATLWPDGKTPENADAQHGGLFPSVRRKIELLAKVILEELSEPQPEEKKPEEPPPEERPQTPSPQEEPEEEYEYTISVIRAGNNVKVKLMKGETTVVERSIDAKMNNFDSAMQEVTDRLGRDLLRLK